MTPSSSPFICETSSSLEITKINEICFNWGKLLNFLTRSNPFKFSWTGLIIIIESSGFKLICSKISSSVSAIRILKEGFKILISSVLTSEIL